MDQDDKDVTASVTETTTPPTTNETEDKADKDVSKEVEASELENTSSKTDEPATPSVSETPANDTNKDADTNQNAPKPSAENVDENAPKPSGENDDFTDAMMENLQEHFNQDVDGMVSLMESAEEFMFESDDKQLNIKAAIEASKRQKEQESKSVINSDKSEAYSLLAQGKRNLFVKDYESAVSTLGEACQKLNSIYGDFAVELADAYMTYGNALLELWRVEEADKKSNEGEKGGVLENVQEENEDDEKDADESENKSDENNENEEGNENGDEKNEDGDENGDEKNEEGEEDIENEDDNLQIAWEVVELAKEIYNRHNDNVNAAKAYLKLGEISIASANYVLSVEDLNGSLDIQMNLSPVDYRLKANTHFNLYVAYSASHIYDKSAEHLDIAKSVFETQVYDLNQKLKATDKSDTAEVAKLTKEINDTEEILRDMDSKVLENNKHKREFMKALVEAIKNKTSDDEPGLSNGSGSSHGSSSSNNLLGPAIKKIVEPSGNNLLGPTTKNLLGSKSSDNVPVNNISNLIRKKPRETVEPSTDTATGNPPVSKPSTTVTLNGQASSNEKTALNSNTESTASANGVDENEKQDNQETTGRKRKASESETCDESPKKVCLEKE